MQKIQVKPLQNDDGDWVAALLKDRWGCTRIVSRGRVHEADTLPGFVATQEGERVGLLTYSVDGKECEIVTIDSLAGGKRIGSALLEAARDFAVSAGCSRLWLITTNDNLDALRFYQKREFVLVAVHRNAISQSRRLKPGIPLIGKDGIPLRDEIELEILL